MFFYLCLGTSLIVYLFTITPQFNCPVSIFLVFNAKIHGHVCFFFFFLYNTNIHFSDQSCFLCNITSTGTCISLLSLLTVKHLMNDLVSPCLPTPIASNCCLHLIPLPPLNMTFFFFTATFIFLKHKFYHFSFQTKKMY